VICGGSILSCCPRNPHGHKRALKEVFARVRVEIPPLLNPAYSDHFKISEAKKKDLKLCRSGAIPEEFHGWYESLPFSRRTREYLSELPTLNSRDDIDVDI